MDFANKYRPSNLDELIGHTSSVQRIRGMLKKELPNAFLFTGPTSVGKTTLARAVAVAINKKPIDKQTDYKELNGADTRTIEDMRDLIKLSKFRPSNTKRIFVIDEAQQIMSNAPAAAALLAPLESGSPDSVFILCSMDPSKFTSGNGKAIANRCQQFALQPPSEEDLTAFAKRIIIGEKMSYMKNGELVKGVVEASQGEMRTLALLIQNCRDFYEGANKKPEKLTMADLSEVLKSSTSSNDELVFKFVTGLMAGKFKEVQAALMDVEDPVNFMNQVTYATGFLLNSMVTSRHKKVWWTPINKKLDAATKGRTIRQAAEVYDLVVSTRMEAASFVVPATELLTRNAYRLIKNMESK